MEWETEMIVKAINYIRQEEGDLTIEDLYTEVILHLSDLNIYPFYEEFTALLEELDKLNKVSEVYGDLPTTESEALWTYATVAHNSLGDNVLQSTRLLTVRMARPFGMPVVVQRLAMKDGILTAFVDTSNGKWRPSEMIAESNYLFLSAK